MREILFRGKSKDDGEWVEGYFVSQGGDAYIFQQEEVDRGIDIGGSLDCCYMCEVDPDTVGQFTGLLDKNGKKIFEGDIIKGNNFLHEDRLIYQVVYEDNGFYYLCEDGCAWHPANIDGVELIANVHDNPEPLKEKENATD